MADGQTLTVDELKKKAQTLYKESNRLYEIWQSSGFKDEAANHAWRKVASAHSAAQHDYDRARILEGLSGDLEKRFANEFYDVIGKIYAKLDEANAALSAACKLADAHGIPFSSNIVVNNDCYIPRNMTAKWEGLDFEAMEELFELEDIYAGEYGSFKRGHGWTKSYC